MPLVFIVDDDSAVLDSIAELLATYKYEVRTFNSAEAFLASVNKTERGCLLCDVRLPGMSGLELQSTIKLVGIDLPVILISGYADSDMAAGALEKGAIAVLEKPIHPHALLEHIQTAIQLSK